MAANKLGRRMHDDICSMVKWSAQIGSGKGVINDEGHACLVRDIGDRADIKHIPSRIADGFAVKSAGARCYSPSIIFRIGAIHKDRVDAPGTQRNVKLRMRTSVETAGRDYIIAWTQQAHH